jgi:tRNA(adenine34) deaminase
MNPPDQIIKEHEGWMQFALKEAEKALSQNEVPVGAVVVHDGQIIGRGSNQTELLQDPTAHAEMIAISAAAAFLKSWRLERCFLYVTLEPCAMCAGAIVLARIENLIFGTLDPKAGACGSLRNIIQDYRLNHYVNLTSGVLDQESSLLLKSFFRKLRKEKQIPE